MQPWRGVGRGTVSENAGAGHERSGRPGLAGVGLGFRAPFASELLAQPSSVDFVEVVAEACFFNRQQHREARALAELWPVVPHGVKLSLGSAEGIEEDRARSLGVLARELRASVITEHAAFVRTSSWEIGHLTALPRSRAALRVIERNLARARKYLPDVPLLLENVAWALPFPVRAPHMELPEPEFYAELVERTGVGLLLDLSNLYANALNAGLDPSAELARFPLHSVGMIHLAGGVFEDGFYFDDHAHPVPERVLELLETTLQNTGDVPIVIERDAEFPPFAELRTEVSRARGMLSGAPPRTRTAGAARELTKADAAADSLEVAALQAEQHALAEALTDPAPSASACTLFDRAGLQRARAILQRKRLEDAAPLLGRLSAHWRELEPWTRSVLERLPRAPRLAAVQDAFEISERAQVELSAPELVFAARVDALVLQARFVTQTGCLPRLRRSPFVARARSPRGVTVWVVKGVGLGAATRILERNPIA